MSNQEILEVIDEGKVQSSDNDVEPAEPVSASLVEIVEEISPNQAQTADFKQPSQTKNSSHSSAIFMFPQHKVQPSQTDHRKPLAKLKQNSARVYPSSSKSKIFTRVSIPGKHRLFNTSHAGTNWRKFLLTRTFTPLEHNTLRENALQISNKLNVRDKERKRINQMERNQASYRDILETFISRMGLNVSSDLHPKTRAPERWSHPRPSKTVLLNKGNTNLPPKKASMQRTSNQRGGYTNFYSARKSTSLSANSLQSPIVIKGVPLVKEEKTSPLEPGVLDSLSDKKFLKSKKNSTSKRGKKYVNNSPNSRILNSSLRDKDAQFLHNIVTGRDKSGLGTHPKSQVSPLSSGVNSTQSRGTTPQLKENKSQDKSRNVVIGRDKSRLGTLSKSQLQVSPLNTSVNNTKTKAIKPQLKKSQNQDNNRNIAIGLSKSGLGTRPKGQVSPLSTSVNNTQTKGTMTQLKKNKSQHKSGNIVEGRDKSGLGTRPNGQVSPLNISTSVNNTQTKLNKSQHKNRNIATGRDKSGLGARPKGQVHISPLRTSVNNTQSKGTTTQLKEKNIVTARDKSRLGTRPKGQISPLSTSGNNLAQTKLNKSQHRDKNKNIVTGRAKSKLGTSPKGQISPLGASVNNTQTKLNKSQHRDKNRNIVTGRDKSGLETRPQGQVSPLSTSVNNTQSKGTTTELKENKSQHKNKTIVTGRDKSRLGTRPKVQISPLGASVNTTQTKLNKSQHRDKNRNIVTGRDKSGLETRPEGQVSPLNTSVNNTKTNTTTTQPTQINETQDKSGNIRDYPKNETYDKHLVNRIKSGRHNSLLAHARKNATHLNSTKLSINTNGTFTLSVDSNSSLRHFSDLINFFNSFNSASDKKPTSNISTGGNISNKFKNGTRNGITSENLLKLLDFARNKKTSGNHTSKRLELTKGHTHSDHHPIADEIRKQLQMSIYRGWNKASKGRRLGSNKLPTSSYSSIKSELTNLHDAMPLKGNDSLKKSKEDDFELGVLRMMKNVSQKELLKLEEDIVHALSSAKLWNLTQQHKNQNPGEQYQISPEKIKYKKIIRNRQHNKQEDLSEKQLNYQHQLNKQGQKLVTLKHRNPKFGQHQNQTHTQRKNKQKDQQIKDSNNEKALHQHELEFESEQSHLQQTNRTRHYLKENNLSHSLESTTTVQNCSLLVSVNTTKNFLNYGCNQTHNKLSPQNNGSKDFLSHSANTSQAKTGALIKNAHAALHNATSVQSTLARHSSARKITRNNTLPLRTGNGTVVAKPGFNVAKDADDTKNISVQLDRDLSQEPVNTESIPEGKTGSGIVELTEFVDQGKLGENVFYSWYRVLTI